MRTGDRHQVYKRVDLWAFSFMLDGARVAFWIKISLRRSSDVQVKLDEAIPKLIFVATAYSNEATKQKWPVGFDQSFRIEGDSLNDLRNAIQAKLQTLVNRKQSTWNKVIVITLNSEIDQETTVDEKRTGILIDAHRDPGVTISFSYVIAEQSGDAFRKDASSSGEKSALDMLRESWRGDDNAGHLAVLPWTHELEDTLQLLTNKFLDLEQRLRLLLTDKSIGQLMVGLRKTSFASQLSFNPKLKS